MSSKKSKAVPHEVIIRKDRENTHHSLLILAKDATIPASSGFSVFMIDTILTYLAPCYLFIFVASINIWQKSLTHDLVVKAVVNFFRQITTEHADYVSTINSLNTASYLRVIIRTIHVPSPMRLLYWLDSLDNPFGLNACQTSLGYGSAVLHNYVIWKEGKGEFSHQYLVTSIPHFCK